MSNELAKEIYEVARSSIIPLPERMRMVRYLTRSEIDERLMHATTDAFFRRESAKGQLQNAPTTGARLVSCWKLARAEASFGLLNGWRLVREANASRRNEREITAWKKKNPLMSKILGL
jgi:hypothetical protein